MTEIGSGVFTNCAKLESITLSENLSVIGVGAFSRCDELKSLYIPASVTNIKGAITTSDFSLTSIKVSSANKKYDSTIVTRDQLHRSMQMKLLMAYASS